MKRMLPIATVVIALGLLPGCSTMKTVFPSLGDDPVGAAITAVEAAVHVAEVQWYGPACSEAESPADFCATWNATVAPAIDAAIKRARRARALALQDLDANEIARAAVGETIAALADVSRIDPDEKRRNIYRHVQTALVLLRVAMQPPDGEAAGVPA